jgi:hypothetical protein
MKVNKIKKGMTELFITKLESVLREARIELYDVFILNPCAVKFRAKRDHSLLYCAGGMRNGQPIHYNPFFTRKLRKSKCLHYEEWALVNDAINEILDDLDANGTCKSFFDGGQVYIRKDGVKLWNGADHI